MQVCNPFRKLFDCQYMIKKEEIQGPLPSSKEAYHIVLAMAWPSVMEAFLIALMASIDTMMVGGLSAEAIAAVGLTNQPRLIILAVIMSLNVGIVAVVARRRGEDDYLGANSCLKQSMMLCLIASSVMAVLGMIFAEPLMVIAGAEADIVPISASYFRIIMVGMIFSAMGMTITAAQRGVGNTRVSMVTNISANIVNVIFNYLLINGIWIFPRLEVDGAAIATVIGNIVACGLAIWSVTKSKHSIFLDLGSKARWRFDRRTLSSLWQVSSSSMAEQVAMRVGFFLTAWLIAQLGTIAFATNQICMQILTMSFALGDGLSIAAASFMGRQLGAKRADLAKLYTSVIQRIALIGSTVMVIIFVVGRHSLIALFTDDASIIASGAVLMIIIACSAHLQTSQVIISGSLRGAGDTRYVAIVSLISIGVLRPFFTWSLTFPLGFGLSGVFLALLLDQIVRFTANFTRFLSGKWSKVEL